MSDETKEGSEKSDYELAFLVRDEGAAPDVLRLLRQHSVEIRSEGQLKKISLSYPIKKILQAFFGFFYLSGLPSDVKSLEKNLASNPVILRSLLVRLPSRKIVEGGAASYRRPMMMPRKPIATESRPHKAAPLSNEALEKKIEEILQ